LNKGDFTKPRCLSAGSYSLYLQLKPTIWAESYSRKYTYCTTPLQERHFFRHHYVMQKNSSCTETEKSYLCKVLHFNRSSV